MQIKNKNVDIEITELIYEYLGVFDLDEGLKKIIVKNISKMDEKAQKGALALIVQNMQELFKVKKGFLDDLKKIRSKKLKELDNQQALEDSAKADELLDSIN